MSTKKTFEIEGPVKFIWDYESGIQMIFIEQKGNGYRTESFSSLLYKNINIQEISDSVYTELSGANETYKNITEYQRYKNITEAEVQKWKTTSGKEIPQHYKIKICVEIEELSDKDNKTLWEKIKENIRKHL